MIEIRVQSSKDETASPQGFAVACMLRENLVKARSSQVNTGEALGKIASRGTNNGMLEHYRSVPALNLS